MSVKACFRLIVHTIDLLDHVICRREDERARRRGWKVERIGFGARAYRDRRFDERTAQAVPEDTPQAEREPVQAAGR